MDVRTEKIMNQFKDINNRFDNSFTPGEERKKEILRLRTERLSMQVEEEKLSNDFIEVVEFKLANETYAIESKYIKEILTFKDFTYIPCTPKFILGITNIRGHIISIVDLKIFFDLPKSGLTDQNKIILLQNEQMIFGILSDTIIGEKDIFVDDIQPSPALLNEIRSDYLNGITKDMIIVLDGNKLLNDPKLIINEDVV